MKNPSLLKTTSLGICAVVLISGCAATNTGTMSNTLPSLCNNRELTCIVSSNTLIIGEPAKISPYAGVIEDAQKLYLKSFKGTPEKAALYLKPNLPKSALQNLKKAGYKVVLPWVTEEAKQAMVRGSIRRQMQNLNPNASEAEIDAMAKGIRTKLRDGANLDTERGAIAHEFAHMWFMHDYFYETNEQHNEEQYGSNAPDWLDEMAAVISENNSLAEQRRKNLKRIAQEEGLKAFWPLEEYFTMEHPMAANASAMIKKLHADGKMPTIKGGGMATVVTFTGAQAEKILQMGGGKNPGNFYVQSRGFADFMIEKSKDPYIFDYGMLFRLRPHIFP